MLCLDCPSRILYAHKRMGQTHDGQSKQSLEVQVQQIGGVMYYELTPAYGDYKTKAEVVAAFRCKTRYGTVHCSVEV